MGSIVLGGYDLSRIEGLPAQFTLNSNATTGELLVNVFSIAIKRTSATAWITSPPPAFSAIVESTLPYLFLPKETCDWLAAMLDLEYDEPSGLYTINETSVSYNLGNRTTFSITLDSSNSTTVDSGIGIKLPYDAFNANASWTWGLNDTQRIFPMRRAPSETAVLGRVFFQEAYIIVDYERGNFSIAQAANSSRLQAHPPNLKNIDALYSISGGNTTDSGAGKVNKLAPGAIAGVVIGIILAICLGAFLLWFFIVKPRRQAEKKEKEDAAKETEKNEIIPTVSELTAKPTIRKHIPEAQNLDSEVHEMENYSKPGELVQEREPAELEGILLTLMRLNREIRTGSRSPRLVIHIHEMRIDIAVEAMKVQFKATTLDSPAT